MRKKRKIKWVVSLVVSFVLMMLAPAISNHPAHAKQKIGRASCRERV